MSERLLDCPPQLGLQGPPPSSGPPKSLAPPRVRSEPRTPGRGWQANRRKTSTPTSTPEQCATPLAGQCKRRPVYVQSLWARKETLMDGSLAVLNSDFGSPARPEPPKSCPESDALGRGRAWILCRPRWETTSATLHAAQFRILISFSPANHMRKQVNNQSFFCAALAPRTVFSILGAAAAK